MAYNADRNMAGIMRGFDPEGSRKAGDEVMSHAIIGKPGLPALFAERDALRDKLRVLVYDKLRRRCKVLFDVVVTVERSYDAMFDRTNMVVCGRSLVKNTKRKHYAEARLAYGHDTGAQGCTRLVVAALDSIAADLAVWLLLPEAAQSAVHTFSTIEEPGRYTLVMVNGMRWTESAQEFPSDVLISRVCLVA